MVQKGGKETWVHVKAAESSYELTIVEKEAMKQEVTADAAALANGLSSTGHAIVEGILFDTGKSQVKPESDAALTEVAKLLKQKTDLKIYVVGHTDNVGDVKSNMKLSSDRAAAVIKVLAEKHGINALRLSYFGAGPYSPVSTNRTEEGRALNRRVELVEQ